MRADEIVIIERREWENAFAVIFFQWIVLNVICCHHLLGSKKTGYRISKTGIGLLWITCDVVLPSSNSRRRLWP